MWHTWCFIIICWKVGGWAAQIELQISCRAKETSQTQLMCETEPSDIYM